MLNAFSLVERRALSLLIPLKLHSQTQFYGSFCLRVFQYSKRGAGTQRSSGAHARSQFVAVLSLRAGGLGLHPQWTSQC